MTILEFIQATGMPENLADKNGVLYTMVFDYYLVADPNDEKGKVYLACSEMERIHSFHKGENVTTVLSYLLRHVYGEGRVVGVYDVKKRFRDLLDIG